LLQGKDAAVGHQVGGLDGNRTTAGADVPQYQVVLDLELGQGYGPHFLFGDQFLGGVKLLVVDADQGVVDQVRFIGPDEDEDIQVRGLKFQKATYGGLG